jgi:uncharacterized protein
MMDMEKIGSVRQINIYPVKSMRGISAEKAVGHWYGLNGDRKFAFVHHDAKTGFPWLTAREIPRLLKYQPVFVSPNEVMKSQVLVDTPFGERIPLDSQKLADELFSDYGRTVTLLKLNRGTYDCMPISLLTTQSLETIQERVGNQLDGRRFRANIIVDVMARQRFPELGWINTLISFGKRPDSAQIQIKYPIKRCMVVNLDPESGTSDPEVLKSIAGELECVLGVYASFIKLGTIEIGDDLYLHH